MGFFVYLKYFIYICKIDLKYNNMSKERFFQLTVGELLDYIKKHKIPKDALVKYQRIEDCYFKEHNWHTTKKKDEAYYGAAHYNDRIKEMLDKKTNGADPDEIAPYYLTATPIDLNNPELLADYIQATQCVQYDDDNGLYIMGHY